MIHFTVALGCASVLVLSIPCAATVGTPLPRPELSTASDLTAAGARISARLSETSFESTQVGDITLRYSFSKLSRSFGYRLSRRDGATWQTIRRVTKTGRFKGTHTLALQRIFAGKTVRAGEYRLKLRADAGSRTLTFTVTATVSKVTPQAGRWESTSLAGQVSGGGLEVTRLQFTVGPDQTTVSAIGFGYTVSWFGCSSGFSGMTSDIAAQIVEGAFEPLSSTGSWSGPVNGSLQGVFDSPTSAHGTGTMSGSMWCKGPTGFNELKSGSTGTFSWTASKQ